MLLHMLLHAAIIVLTAAYRDLIAALVKFLQATTAVGVHAWAKLAEKLRLFVATRRLIHLLTT